MFNIGDYFEGDYLGSFLAGIVTVKNVTVINGTILYTIEDNATSTCHTFNESEISHSGWRISRRNVGMGFCRSGAIYWDSGAITPSASPSQPTLPNLSTALPSRNIQLGPSKSTAIVIPDPFQYSMPSSYFTKPECQHQWKLYDSGFTAYHYCSKCDIKKEQ